MEQFISFKEVLYLLNPPNPSQFHLKPVPSNSLIQQQPVFSTTNPPNFLLNPSHPIHNTRKNNTIRLAKNRIGPIPPDQLLQVVQLAANLAQRYSGCDGGVDKRRNISYKGLTDLVTEFH